MFVFSAVCKEELQMCIQGNFNALKDVGSSNIEAAPGCHHILQAHELCKMDVDMVLLAGDIH